MNIFFNVSQLSFNFDCVGHFYLTYLLLDKLKASAPSRVVVVSSTGHKFRGKLDFKDLQMTHSWNQMGAYAKSKTANILFASHLGKLLAGIHYRGYYFEIRLNIDCNLFLKI